MRELREYFHRIQGRLVLAFGIVITGTIVIWWFGMLSMSQLTDEVSARMDQLHKSLDMGSRLESTILSEMLSGEHYVATGDTVSRNNAGETDVPELLRSYATLPGIDAKDSQQLAEITNLHNRLQQEYAQAIADRDRGDMAAAIARLNGVQQVAGELKALLRSLNGSQSLRVENAARQVEKDAMHRQLALMIVLLLTTLGGVLFVLRMIHAINGPLQRLVEIADQFGKGDLSVTMDGAMPSEFRVLAGAFGSMGERLREVVGKTVSTADRIGTSATNLSSISEEVAASSGEVANAMVEITSGAEAQASGLRTVDSALGQIRRNCAG